METVAQVCTALEAVLSTAATRAAWTTEFVQRTSKLTGPVFVQTLVLGYLQDPQASWSQLAGIAGQLGVPITAQGLYQRCGVAGAECLRAVLAAATRQVVAGAPPLRSLLARFAAVVLQDSTTLTLPAALGIVWGGGGGGGAGGGAPARQLPSPVCFFCGAAPRAGMAGGGGEGQGGG